MTLSHISSTSGVPVMVINSESLKLNGMELLFLLNSKSIGVILLK